MINIAFASDSTQEAQEALESMVSEVYDNYKKDPEFTYDDIVDVVNEHMEEMYYLSMGTDYSYDDVIKAMKEYEWCLPKEDGASINKWQYSRNSRV